MRRSIMCTLLILSISMFSGLYLYAVENNTPDIIEASSIVYPDGYEAKAGSKTVYLTFDDGPTKYTPEILNILAEYDVPATFFVVGNTQYTHYISDIVENSHAIGLHSYDHNFSQIYSSTEAFFKDLQKIDDIVYDMVGVRSKIMRFPGGSSARAGGARSIMKQLKEEVRERGYQFFDWNVDSSDKVNAKTVDAATRRIKSSSEKAGDIVIVLMHDTEKITVQYLPAVIEHFKNLGYEFLPLCPESPAVHHSW